MSTDVKALYFYNFNRMASKKVLFSHLEMGYFEGSWFLEGRVESMKIFSSWKIVLKLNIFKSAPFKFLYMLTKYWFSDILELATNWPW